MSSSRLRVSALALLCFCLTSCGGGRSAPSLTLSPPSERASGIWERFIRAAGTAESIAGPFRSSGTLFYAGKEDSQKVSVYFWGNGDKQTPYPLRLDIMAGIGDVMAKIHETREQFVAYVPKEHIAYTHKSGRQNFIAFGVPLPFSLEDLSLLVTGRYGPLFLPSPSAVPEPRTSAETDAAVTFYLENARLPGTLDINVFGLPVGWRDVGATGWHMVIEYWPDNTRPTPHKVTLTNLEGASVTVVLRETASPEPFTQQQLSLSLPPDVVFRALQVK